MKKSLRRKKNCAVSERWQVDLLVVNVTGTPVVIHWEYHQTGRLVISCTSELMQQYYYYMASKTTQAGIFLN
jgi:hypothetical protein